MIKLLSSLFLTHRFFYAWFAVAALYVFAFVFPALSFVALAAFAALLLSTAIDGLMLFSSKGVSAKRFLPEKFSNGDENPVSAHIANNYAFKISALLIDELPAQFQIRNFRQKHEIPSGSRIRCHYPLRPTERGRYHFGRLHVYAQTQLGLLSRRYSFEQQCEIACYPGFLQLRKYDLSALATLSRLGIKRTRRLGQAMEFEQIKDYATGDDLRTLNWKATAKRNTLMVNQYQDQRSQQVYMIIDKGRQMQMPFNGLRLLDYAVNSALVLSNIVLLKNDLAGMLSISKRIGNTVSAQKTGRQMHRILEALYNVQTDSLETDFGLLYAHVRRHLRQRSLLVIFSNFETGDNLQRQLPYLKAMSRFHLVLVVFFTNSELVEFSHAPAHNPEEVYDKIAAEKLIFEKRLIVQKLRQNGIHTLLTPPEALTTNTINAYLDFKARGLI